MRGDAYSDHAPERLDDEACVPEGARVTALGLSREFDVRHAGARDVGQFALDLRVARRLASVGRSRAQRLRAWRFSRCAIALRPHIISPVAATPTLHRLAPELYDRMVDAGLLEGEPIELVDGLLVHVTPQGRSRPPRRACLRCTSQGA